VSEKKAKEARREANTPVIEYLITVYKDNRIQIKGEIDNFPLFRDVMNRAERAVLNRLQARLQEAQNNKIIVPNIVPPNNVSPILQ